MLWVYVYFFFGLQNLIDRINSYFQSIALRRNYGRKSPVNIKYENLHSCKERVILLCYSILEARRISDLHGSALFTIPLRSSWRI